jgi:hypothetical protein
MPSPSLKNSWTVAWNSRRERYQMIIGILIMLAIIFTLPAFFAHIQKRKGAVLNDWLLAHIPPHNVSVLIFALIWGMILLILVRTVKNPSIYITYCWTLIFVYIVRFVTLSLVALDPPRGLVPLVDPLGSVFYGNNAAITKDLFFSGHTTTMVLIFLCLERRTDKIIALIAAFAVACLLLVQHIHYTIDVLAVPVVVYPCYRLTRYLFFK